MAPYLPIIINNNALNSQTASNNWVLNLICKLNVFFVCLFTVANQNTLETVCFTLINNRREETLSYTLTDGNISLLSLSMSLFVLFAVHIRYFNRS